MRSYLPIAWNSDENEYIETLIGVCDAIPEVFTQILHNVKKMKWNRSILDEKDELSVVVHKSWLCGRIVMWQENSNKFSTSPKITINSGHK